MRAKQMIFLELRSNRVNVKLPYRLLGEDITASLVNWDFAPITYVSNLNAEVISPYYFQLRLDGAFETNFLPYGASKDMVQIPLIRSGGWPVSGTAMQLPLAKGKAMENSFEVRVYGEGEFPAPWVFGADTRLLLWLLVEWTPDPASSSTHTYIS